MAASAGAVKLKSAMTSEGVTTECIVGWARVWAGDGRVGNAPTHVGHLVARGVHGPVFADFVFWVVQALEAWQPAGRSGKAEYAEY